MKKQTVFEMARGWEWWKVEQNKNRGKEVKVWVKGTAENRGREEGKVVKDWWQKKPNSLELAKINSSLGLNLPLLLEPEGKATVELSYWVSGW